jgi:hypothetical protein
MNERLTRYLAYMHMPALTPLSCPKYPKPKSPPIPLAWASRPAGRPTTSLMVDCNGFRVRRQMPLPWMLRTILRVGNVR